MDDTIKATLAGWADFYLITGTAAAALTGLQFVVQTLLASNAHRALGGRDPTGGIEAFGTPTVVHFTLALVVSAVVCVPWRDYGSLRATLGILGAGALAYSAVVLPGAAYAAILLAAALLGRGAGGPLFAVAAATLLLLCVGIHNAWDTVTYLTVSAVRAVTSEGEPAPPGREDA